jgi:hypothetical protein
MRPVLIRREWPVPVQLGAVFAQPARLLLPAVAGGSEQTPESLAVTRDTEMAELVNDDVFEYVRWSEQKPP